MGMDPGVSTLKNGIILNRECSLTLQFLADLIHLSSCILIFAAQYCCICTLAVCKHYVPDLFLSQASNATPKFNKTTSGKLKRVDHYKKNESRKYERLHFERKLQSNLDQYVTRAVTELVYRMPDDLADPGDDDDDAEERGNRDEGGSQDGTAPVVAHNDGTEGQRRDSAHAALTSAALADIMERERFPIPMEVREQRRRNTLG